MLSQLEREALVLGTEAVERLSEMHVAVFGVGGVGGYAVEALARAGIGELTLYDNDCVSESNLNRQLFALHSTVGKRKVDVAAARVLDINPKCKVHVEPVFVTPENLNEMSFIGYDYIIDAIDTVKSKLALIEKAKTEKVLIISAMGAGNKLDPTAFRVADISETSVCPLAKVIRVELRKRGIHSLKVVYSQELPTTAAEPMDGEKRVPGSVSFVPPVVGMILAGEVIKELAGLYKEFYNE